MAYFVLAAFISYTIVGVVVEDDEIILARILTLVASTFAILLLSISPVGLSPETTQAVLGVVAGIFCHMFPKWEDVRHRDGEGGVRTWWLLSLAVGLFLTALTALLAPYGPSLFSRMSKVAFGTADFEFAAGGLGRQRPLAEDRDLADQTSLAGAVELPFAKYECGLAALRNGGIDNFKNLGASRFPSYQDFQNAVGFLTKSQFAKLVHGIRAARGAGYGEGQLQEEIRPIARDMYDLIFAHYNASFNSDYTALITNITKITDHFIHEHLTLDSPQSPESPSWCSYEGKYDDFAFAESFRGLMDRTRYVHSLAAVLLGFTGNSEAAIKVAERADDLIVWWNSPESKAMEMNTKDILATQYYFGEREFSLIKTAYDVGFSIEKTEQDQVSDCSKYPANPTDQDICKQLTRRYQRAYPDIEQEMAYFLAQEDVDLAAAKTYAEAAYAAYRNNQFYLTSGVDYDMELSARDTYAYTILAEQRHRVRVGLPADPEQIRSARWHLEELFQRVRDHQIPLKGTFYTEHERKLWLRRLSIHLNLADSLSQ